ncbi:MAG: hypothetical protein LCH63_11195 [Candidatus Melainabacteria bacterium]|nr:hypothetical protein [Candidatus Melainabacteria bacterium]
MATDKVSEKPEEKKETAESVAQKAGEKLAACAYDPTVKTEKSAGNAYDRLQRSNMEMEAILNNNRFNNGPKIYDGAFGVKAGSSAGSSANSCKVDAGKESSGKESSTKSAETLKEKADSLKQSEPSIIAGLDLRNFKAAGNKSEFRSEPEKTASMDYQTESTRGVTDTVKNAQTVKTELDKAVERAAETERKGDLVKIGDKMVKYNDKGEVIYSKEGSIVTVTEGGKNYVYDEASKVKEVWGPKGLEVRVYPDGTTETPDGKDGKIRFDASGKKIWTVDKDGRITSEIRITENGEAVIKMKDTQYERINTNLDTSDPAKLKEAMEKLYKEGKRGVIEFNNAKIYLNDFEYTKSDGTKGSTPNYLLVADNGLMLQRIFDNSLVKDAKGNISLIDKDGHQHTQGSQAFEALKDQINARARWFNGDYVAHSIKEILGDKVTSADQTTTLSGERTSDGTFAKTTAESKDIKVETTTATGETVITNNENGMVLSTKPGQPGFSITTADGRKIERDNQGLKIGDLRVNGTNVTDERTGVRMSERGIESSQVKYDSSTGRASFSDGSALEADGTYVRMSNTLVSDSSKKAAQQAAEGRAMGLARAAEAQALSLIAKAASGRVSASDIDALSASLGSIEGSIKALSDQGDMISMVKLMMTKGTVSESLGKAQQMVGKQSLVA